MNAFFQRPTASGVDGIQENFLIGACFTLGRVRENRRQVVFSGKKRADRVKKQAKKRQRAKNPERRAGAFSVLSRNHEHEEGGRKRNG